jgi:hypothetical protein
MKLNCIRATICSIIAAASILTGCSSPQKYDDSDHLAKKPATSYSTQAETEAPNKQAAAPTAAMTKLALGGRQPLLTLDSLFLPEQSKTALSHSVYNSSQFDLSSFAPGYDRQIILTPTEGLSMYFDVGEGSGKSNARKLATRELLKQVQLDKISIMLPRDLSLYNELNFNAGIRFGAPDIRDLVQALATKEREKWNDVLSGFKLGCYINYATNRGNFSIGAGVTPQYNLVEAKIKLDAPVVAEYRIKF